MKKQQSAIKKDLLIIISGLFGGLATIALVVFFNETIGLVWGDFFGLDTTDPKRSFIAPLALIFAGLIVGLVSKYFGGVLGGLEAIVEQVSQKGGIAWRDAPRTLLISFISVVSGASLGPEAPSTVASAGGSSWLAEKSKSELKIRKAMGVSSLVGMLGGFFILVGHSSDGSFGVPASIPDLAVLPLALVLGIAGALMAVLSGYITFLLEPLFARFDKKPVKKALLGSSLVAVLVFAAPLTMFSGQYVLPALAASAGGMSFAGLLALALAKLLSTDILLRSGFFGGPIFPALFAGSAVGLAFSYLFTGSTSLIVAASLAGLLTITLKKPVIAGLLAIAFSGTAGLPSVLLGVAGGMLVGSVSERYKIPGSHIKSSK